MLSAGAQGAPAPCLWWQHGLYRNSAGPKILTFSAPVGRAARFTCPACQRRRRRGTPPRSAPLPLPATAGRGSSCRLAASGRRGFPPPALFPPAFSARPAAAGFPVGGRRSPPVSGPVPASSRPVCAIARRAVSGQGGYRPAFGGCAALRLALALRSAPCLRLPPAASLRSLPCARLPAVLGSLRRLRRRLRSLRPPGCWLPSGPALAAAPVPGLPRRGPCPGGGVRAGSLAPGPLRRASLSAGASFVPALFFAPRRPPGRGGSAAAAAGWGGVLRTLPPQNCYLRQKKHRLSAVQNGS